MARARNIKPSFFHNEDIVELSFEARLLFIGLWTLADREGRLENRPKKIKMALFPADEINVSELLLNISKYGFIKLYNIAGTQIIQITNFIKHQAPHGLEKDSELPDENGMYTVYRRNPKNKTVIGDSLLLPKEQLADFYANTGEFSLENPKKQTKNRLSNTESTNQKQTKEPIENDSEQDKNSFETVSISYQNALNPDSLNPDSLNPESIDLKTTHTTREEKTENQILSEVANATAEPLSLKNTLKLWNPPLNEVNAWLQQSGLKPMTQQDFENLKPAFLGHYAPQIQIGTLPTSKLYAKLVSWVKRDFEKPKPKSTTAAKPKPNLNVNAAWDALPKNDQPLPVDYVLEPLPEGFF